MAETLISPGVLARENDSSFITQQPVNVGAAIIGPTVLGPVEIPTVVTSYSDYVNRFGAGFQSGSDNVSFFTSIAAYNYFNNGGTSLLVARVVSASNTWTSATSTHIENNTFSTTASFTFNSASIANFIQPTGSFNVNGVIIAVTGSPAPANTTNTIFVSSGSTAANTITAIVTAFNVSKSIAPYSASLQYITSSVSASTGIFFNTVSPVGPAGDLYYVTSGSTTSYFTGGSGATAFVLKTLSEGIIMNSSSSMDVSGSLASGSADNIRYQILNSDKASGTFSLLIRQGNDNTNNPIVLETWTGLSLDPFAANFISKVLGDQDQNYNSTNNQIEVSGSYFNASRYVRVSAVNTPTPYYFDNTGVAKSQYTSSIPVNSSGSFTGGVGQVAAGANFYETINGTNTQGLVGADYDNMIDLLANQDEYKFNILFAP